MTDNRRMLAGLLLLAVLILVVYYLPMILESGMPLFCFEDGVCQHEQYVGSLIAYMPAVLILGFVIGIILAYLYFERKIDIPHPAQDKSAILLLLNPTERKIIKRIIDDGGSSLQSDISRLEGIGKVRAHRTIDKLIRRGVLEKEEKGKTNVLKLKKEVMDAI